VAGSPPSSAPKGRERAESGHSAHVHPVHLPDRYDPGCGGEPECRGHRGRRRGCPSTRHGGATRRRSRCARVARGRATSTCPRDRPGRACTPSRCGIRRYPRARTRSRRAFLGCTSPSPFQRPTPSRRARDSPCRFEPRGSSCHRCASSSLRRVSSFSALRSGRLRRRGRLPSMRVLMAKAPGGPAASRWARASASASRAASRRRD
jgi:hypothetical protein